MWQNAYMSTSLIPERPLLISPTLAATIGLDEAVLLHVISELLLQQPAMYRRQRRWCELPDNMLGKALPFWSYSHIKQVLQSLQGLGLILCDPVPGQNDARLVAINQPDEPPAGSQSRSRSSGKRSAGGKSALRPGTGGVATPIPADWEPDETLLKQCEQRNIPPYFIDQELPAFVSYWRERGKVQYSWHHTFLSWVVTRWEKQRSLENARDHEELMTPEWLPSIEATSILEHAGISLCFIEDAVPEFILYWRERGIRSSEWNSKFIAHVRRQWVRYTHALENDTTPRPIPPDFQPSPACFDVLAMANIDSDFAVAQLPEFILYWQDRNEAQSSWNTKFLQHVKYKWAQQMQHSRPILDKLTDRSWAE